MWQEIWSTVQSEFSDIPDATQITRIMLRLLVAALLGGLLGYEREQHGKSAGVRTHMLVAMGAALFVLVPQIGGAQADAMSRVVQGVIAGIGFYLWYRRKEKQAGYTGQFMGSFWIPLSVWVLGMVITTVMTLKSLAVWF